jgi:hypothetical protein
MTELEKLRKLYKAATERLGKLNSLHMTSSTQNYALKQQINNLERDNTRLKTEWTTSQKLYVDSIKANGSLIAEINKLTMKKQPVLAIEDMTMIPNEDPRRGDPPTIARADKG